MCELCCIASPLCPPGLDVSHHLGLTRLMVELSAELAVGLAQYYVSIGLLEKSRNTLVEILTYF